MIEDKDYLKHIKEVTGSDSLCLAKWYNATIWLGSGQTTSCHHPPAHAIDTEAIKTNPTAIHNTDQKKMDRLMMQNGERPEGCSYCWKLEDMGQVSDRVYKTKIHDSPTTPYGKITTGADSVLDLAAKTDFKEDINLKTLEISFDRTCNFACSYCNPAFSTTWAKDIKENGPYENLISDGRNHFTHTHPAVQPYKVGEENPYVEAFWKWWDKDLAGSLKEIRITGGEPTMSADFWKFMEKIADNQRPDLNVAFNSNLGCSRALFDNLLGYSTRRSFDLYTSCESTGEMAEYIRDGLDYDIFLSRLDEIIFDGNFNDVSVMCTINALCLWGLTDFLDQLVAFRRKDNGLWHAKGEMRPSFTLNILRFPSFQSALVLPEELRKGRRQVLEGWLWKQDHIFLHEHEIDHMQRLIEYLREPEPIDIEARRHDFKQFYTQYDLRRNKSFERTFPEELVEWYKTL